MKKYPSSEVHRVRHNTACAKLLDEHVNHSVLVEVALLRLVFKGWFGLASTLLVPVQPEYIYMLVRTTHSSEDTVHLTEEHDSGTYCRMHLV